MTDVAGPTIAVVADPVSSIDEGAEATLAGTVTDPDGATLTATIDPGDGTGPVTVTPDADGAVTLTHRYADDGSYQAEIEACAADERCGAATSTVTVGNVAPTVDAGRDRSTTGSVTLDDASFTDPGTLDLHTATVDWGDGSDLEPATVTSTTGGGSVQASHTYDAPGTYTVEVCVADDDTSGCDQAEVVVTDDAEVTPVVTPTPVDPGEEGTPVDLTFTATDAEGRTLTATVRWADGSDPEPVELTAGAGTATHTYADDGTYGATVEVCAEGGPCTTVPVSVEIDNADPAVTEPTVELTGGDADLTATVTDPGTADTHTATVDWGDGTTDENVPVVDGEVTAGHTYAEPGTFTVEVCVTDDDGAEACASTSVTVDPPNTAPVLAVDPPAATPEGADLTLSGTVTDPDADQTWTITVDWGDGSTEDLPLATSGPFELTHAYADDGEYQVAVEVTDGTDTDATTVYGVTVTNVAPTVELDLTVDDADASLTAKLTDPGTDTLTATVGWGDGTVGDLAPATSPRARTVASGPDGDPHLRGRRHLRRRGLRPRRGRRPHVRPRRRRRRGPRRSRHD